MSQQVIVLSFQISYNPLRNVAHRLMDSRAGRAGPGNLTDRTALFPGPGRLQKNTLPIPPQLTILPTSLAFPTKEIYNNVASWPMMMTGSCLLKCSQAGESLYGMAPGTPA